MILAALAAAAWLAVGLGVGARGGAAGGARRLVPDVAAADVISVELRRGDVAVIARRTERGFVDAEGAPAIDAAAIETLLNAVEFTWVRRLRRGAGSSAELGLDNPRSTLSVGTAGARVRELRLGAALDDRGLVWVGVGGDAALITDTEAGQLFPEPRALRERRPFRGDPLTGLEVRAGGEPSLIIGGDPLAVEVAGGKARVDAEELEAIAESLRGLRLAEGSPSADRAPLTVRLASADRVEWIESRSDCGAGRLYVASAIGAGCVDAAPLEALRAADPATLVDDALIDPDRRFASVLLRRGDDEISIDPRSAGRAAVLDWLAGLAAITAAPARPAGADPGPPAAVLEIRYAADPIDRIAVWRAGGGWLARRNDEPVWLPVDGVAPLLAAEPIWFRAPELIERDPSELRSARRGDVELDRAAIAPLVAHLTAERFVAARAAPQHGLARPRATIELVFDEPPVDTGEPDAYRLEIGATTEGGCFARLAPGDGAVFVLGVTTCDGLLR